ncbi:sugar phosphate nucleotidyltransferase [Candidatus Latescibacterota bacterium]
MKAIVPMAGKGTRLRPLTHSTPKALLRVGAKPILGHIIDSLLTIGVDHLVIIISTEGGDIPAYLHTTYPALGLDVIVQKEKLGLGHAVSLTEQTARGSEIIIIYGDTIIDGDISGLIDPSVDSVVSVKEVEDPRRFGVVNVRDGFITRFVEKPEKPESNLAIIGLNYIKNSTVLFDCLREVIDRNIKTKGEYQITDAFELMLDRGLTMKPYPVSCWFDAGTHETLLETNAHMLKTDANSENLPGSVIIPPVFIHPSAKITHAIIGPHVTIGENASIENSIIADSIINDNARVRNALLRSSLIGRDTFVVGQNKKMAIGDHSSIEFE